MQRNVQKTGSRKQTDILIKQSRKGTKKMIWSCDTASQNNIFRNESRILKLSVIEYSLYQHGFNPDLYFM
jgi:hypothetical protein